MEAVSKGAVGCEDGVEVFLDAAVMFCVTNFPRVLVFGCLLVLVLILVESLFLILMVGINEGISGL